MMRRLLVFVENVLLAVALFVMVMAVYVAAVVAVR